MEVKLRFLNTEKKKLYESTYMISDNIDEVKIYKFTNSVNQVTQAEANTIARELGGKHKPIGVWHNTNYVEVIKSDSTTKVYKLLEENFSKNLKNVKFYRLSEDATVVNAIDLRFNNGDHIVIQEIPNG